MNFCHVSCDVVADRRANITRPRLLMSDDTRQFERLYSDLAPALTGYFRQFPHLCSVAEDLVQDTFMRAFRCRERLGAA